MRGDCWGCTGDVGRGRAGGETSFQGEASPGRLGAREGPAGTENPSVHGVVGQTCWGEPAARLSQFAVQRVCRSACWGGEKNPGVKGLSRCKPAVPRAARSLGRGMVRAQCPRRREPSAAGQTRTGTQGAVHAGGRASPSPGPSARALPTASISQPGSEGAAKRRGLAESVRQRRRLRLGSFTHSPDGVTGISRGTAGSTPAGKSKVLTAGRGGAAVVSRDPLTHTHT